jgi:CO/xanthine dehydrogenase FAD-binding subunit
VAEITSRVYYPASLPELFSEWAKVPQAILYAGSAGWIQNQTERLFLLPEKIISLEGIAELKNVSRTERYLEIGSMVTLMRIARLGKIVPEALAAALRSTMTLLLRSPTSIGSCICRWNTPEPVIASLVALDAKYELRTAAGSRWVSASQFSSASGKNAVLQPEECLTRIRIPLEIWNYTLCRDFSAKESGDNGNEFAVFLSRMQGDILREVRVIFSGATILRDRDSELALVGKKLPLDKKTTATFMEIWKTSLAEIDNRSDFQKAKLLNFVDSAIHYFAY